MAKQRKVRGLRLFVGHTTQNYQRGATFFKCHVAEALGYAQRPENTVVPQVIVHTAMDAVLGALLALALIDTNRHLFELSFLIAAGATLSGLIFTTVEINSPPAKRRIISPPDKRGDSEK